MSPLLLALLELFSAFVLAWLRERLKQAHADLAGTLPDDPLLAVHDLFAQARRKLTIWDRLLGRVRALDAAERVALRRAKELAEWTPGATLVLTGAEYEAVINA